MRGRGAPSVPRTQLAGSPNYLETPSADPTYLYQNTLVALDPDKGINNGTPFFHAVWIGAVAPLCSRRHQVHRLRRSQHHRDGRPSLVAAGYPRCFG
jgi:hypothetical protein